MSGICPVCAVDHATTWPDLSHATVALIMHTMERIDWMEWPANGDMIARQRAGILDTSLLFTTTDPEDIDWDEVARQRTARNEHCTNGQHPDCDGTVKAPTFGWDTCTCHPPAHPNQ